jgi:hypothetical protein
MHGDDDDRPRRTRTSACARCIYIYNVNVDVDVIAFHCHAYACACACRPHQRRRPAMPPAPPAAAACACAYVYVLNTAAVRFTLLFCSARAHATDIDTVYTYLFCIARSARARQCFDRTGRPRRRRQLILQLQRQCTGYCYSTVGLAPACILDLFRLSF